MAFNTEKFYALLGEYPKAEQARREAIDAEIDDLFKAVEESSQQQAENPGGMFNVMEELAVALLEQHATLGTYQDQSVNIWIAQYCTPKIVDITLGLLFTALSDGRLTHSTTYNIIRQKHAEAISKNSHLLKDVPSEKKPEAAFQYYDDLLKHFDQLSQMEETSSVTAAPLDTPAKKPTQARSRRWMLWVLGFIVASLILAAIFPPLGLTPILIGLLHGGAASALAAISTWVMTSAATIIAGIASALAIGTAVAYIDRIPGILTFIVGMALQVLYIPGIICAAIAYYTNVALSIYFHLFITPSKMPSVFLSPETRKNYPYFHNGINMTQGLLGLIISAALFIVTAPIAFIADKIASVGEWLLDTSWVHRSVMPAYDTMASLWRRLTHRIFSAGNPASQENDSDDEDDEKPTSGDKSNQQTTFSEKLSEALSEAAKEVPFAQYTQSLFNHTYEGARHMTFDLFKERKERASPTSPDSGNTKSPKR